MNDLTDAHRAQANRLSTVLIEVEQEIHRAMAKFHSMSSGHEGYGIILEELDELWHEVKHGTKEKSYTEAIQVAAMAIRFVVDLRK
jgi:hypothetical protein